jgi:hypothetical protein
VWLRTGTSVVLLWTGLCGSGQGQVLCFSGLDCVAEDRNKCCGFVDWIVWLRTGTSVVFLWTGLRG